MRHGRVNLQFWSRWRSKGARRARRLAFGELADGSVYSGELLAPLPPAGARGFEVYVSHVAQRCSGEDVGVGRAGVFSDYGSQRNGSGGVLGAIYQFRVF